MDWDYELLPRCDCPVIIPDIKHTTVNCGGAATAKVTWEGGERLVCENHLQAMLKAEEDKLIDG